MIAKLFKYLPTFLRVRIMRSKVRISEPLDGMQIKVATTQEELEKAYSLLHDCYVDMKLMTPDESGLRCNYFTFLPYTTTVVAKVDDVVVGTVALIKDSPMGLPSDKDFKEENDKLRLSGQRIFEISSLATDRNVRKKGHVVSLYLMKYLQRYTTEHMGCTTATGVIHPRASDFYRTFWNAKSSKKIIQYKFVNGALGRHVSANISNKVLDKLTHKFPADENKNIIKFLKKEEAFLIYPLRRFQHFLDPVYTPELLKYFMSERTRIYQSFDEGELTNIYESYKLFFSDLHRLDFFKDLNVKATKRKNFRFFARVRAELIGPNNAKFVGFISDLSENGAFLVTEELLDTEVPYQFEFALGPHQFSIPVSLRWRNRRIRLSNRVGYGIAFDEPQAAIKRLFTATHMSKNGPSSQTLATSKVVKKVS